MEYGHRPYMTDKPFSEQMRLFTDKAVGDLHPVRHSEFKQPYLNWSYPEMEYWWDWPPWMTIKFPGIDFPWLTPYQPNIGRIENPCDFAFYADLDDVCWCPSETLCYYVAVFHPIVAVKLTNPEWHGNDFNVSGVANMVCITAADDPMGNPEVNVWMRAICEGHPVDGSHEKILISECWPPGDKCCSGENYNYPEWDQSESIETIDQDDTGIVAIVEDEYDETYGLPPYTWTVSGTDFYMQNTKTMSKDNVLIAGPDACGLAEITVTDRCGNQCEGVVECGEGDWGSIPISDMYVAAPSPSGGSNWPCDIEPGYIWDRARTSYYDANYPYTWVQQNYGCAFPAANWQSWSLGECMGDIEDYDFNGDSRVPDGVNPGVYSDPCTGNDTQYICEDVLVPAPTDYFDCLYYIDNFPYDDHPAVGKGLGVNYYMKIYFVLFGKRKWGC